MYACTKNVGIKMHNTCNYANSCIILRNLKSCFSFFWKLFSVTVEPLKMDTFEQTLQSSKGQDRIVHVGHYVVGIGVSRT